MAPQHSTSVRVSRKLLIGAALASVGLLAGCASTGAGEINPEYGFATVEQIADSPITIWVDATGAAVSM